MQSKFLKSRFGIGSRSGAAPEQPATSPMPGSAQRDPAIAPASAQKPPEPVPGNFHRFEFFIQLKIGDTVHIGSPKVAIRNSVTGVVRWGATPEWQYPGPNHLQIPWVDDERNGLTSRKLERPEDILGAEGRIGDMRLSFERILDLGRNVVVYALYAPEKNIRLAYGFNRDAVEPGYISPAMEKLK